MTTAASLTPDQLQRTDRAREVLAQPHGYEPADMAGRIGRLEWHLQEMLSLVGELAADQAVGS